MPDRLSEPMTLAVPMLAVPVTVRLLVPVVKEPDEMVRLLLTVTAPVKVTAAALLSGQVAKGRRSN